MATTMLISKINFFQDGDTWDSDNSQELELSRWDSGNGVYWVLQSKRWAFDDPSEIAELLQWAEKAADVERQFAERGGDAKPE